MTNQIQSRTGNRRQTVEQAIQLAIQGRWAEAERLNRQLIAAFPDDVDAHNRLGKALTELGRYGEARESYTRALDLDMNNSIARKNLARLATLREEPPTPVPSGEKVDPHLFVEETGKTGVTALRQPDTEALARMTAGDRVYLKQRDKSLLVENARGVVLGTVESRLGLRLIKLLEGGNEYAAAIASLDPRGARVIIKETYQHPSQSGRLSFPPLAPDGFRPYTKESLVRHEFDEDDAEPNEEWDGEAEGTETEVPLYEHLRRTEPEEKDDEDEE